MVSGNNILKYIIKRDKDKLTSLLTPDFVKKIQRIYNTHFMLRLSMRILMIRKNLLNGLKMQ